MRLFQIINKINWKNYFIQVQYCESFMNTKYVVFCLKQMWQIQNSHFFKKWRPFLIKSKQNISKRFRPGTHVAMVLFLGH